MSSEMKITPEMLGKSYTQIFTEQIPEVLFYQRDRPHYYNLLLKLIAFFILTSLSVPLTLLPIYPILSIMFANNFDVNSSFSGGTGKMNLQWLAILYVFYIFTTTNAFTSDSSIDSLGGSSFVGLFSLLTPILLFSSWWYAMPVSIHDTFAKIYNSIYESHPFLKGGVAYSSMKCPTDVVARIDACRSGQTGEGYSSLLSINGMGFTELILIGLIGILMTLTIVYIWSTRLTGLENDKSKLNTRHINSSPVTFIINKTHT